MLKWSVWKAHRCHSLMTHHSLTSSDAWMQIGFGVLFGIFMCCFVFVFNYPWERSEILVGILFPGNRSFNVLRRLKLSFLPTICFVWIWDKVLIVYLDPTNLLRTEVCGSCTQFSWVPWVHWLTLVNTNLYPMWYREIVTNISHRQTWHVWIEPSTPIVIFLF